jgi:Icc-related predicted phosphoesterase
MKVLFFIDTHGNESWLKKVLDRAKDVDLIVCGGDITIFENDMNKILRKINNVGKPVLIIHGNHETATGLMMECSNLKNLHFIHKNYYIVNDLVFYGYGGGGFSVRDESFTHSMNLFLEDLKKLSNENHKHYRLVLITHAPPFGTNLDDLGDGFSHVGNQSITDFIIKHQPIIAMSGHIHESAGMSDKINNSRLINPGWDGMIIDL